MPRLGLHTAVIPYTKLKSAVLRPYGPICKPEFSFSSPLLLTNTSAWWGQSSIDNAPDPPLLSSLISEVYCILTTSTLVEPFCSQSRSLSRRQATGKGDKGERFGQPCGKDY